MQVHTLLSSSVFASLQITTNTKLLNFTLQQLISKYNNTQQNPYQILSFFDFDAPPSSPSTPFLFENAPERLSLTDFIDHLLSASSIPISLRLLDILEKIAYPLTPVSLQLSGRSYKWISKIFKNPTPNNQTLFALWKKAIRYQPYLCNTSGNRQSINNLPTTSSPQYLSTL